MAMTMAVVLMMLMVFMVFMMLMMRLLVDVLVDRWMIYRFLFDVDAIERVA